MHPPSEEPLASAAAAPWRVRIVGLGRTPYSHIYTHIHTQRTARLQLLALLLPTQRIHSAIAPARMTGPSWIGIHVICRRPVVGASANYTYICPINAVSKQAVSH